MSDIPMPPGFKSNNRTPAQPDVSHSTDIVEKPYDTKVNRDEKIRSTDIVEKPYDTKVNRDETMYILRKTLLPEHREDPIVIGFIKEYLQCRSVAQAARAVGLKTNQGSTLLRRPDIHEAISVITQRAVMKHGYDAGEVIERVKEIMRVDPADFQNVDGSFIERLSEIAPEARRAIRSMKVKNEYGEDPNGMKVVTGKVISIEFWDKLKSVELLGREKNIFKETKVVTHDLTTNMSSVLLESKKRAEERTVTIRDVGEIKEITGGDDEER